MNEISGSETNQKVNIDSHKIEQSLIAQADGNIVQYSGVTFNETKIIQSSFEDIKHREFISTSPYKGLKKFDCEDKDLFFGRDQFLTGLVNELEQSNLILLMGASGSGKSSVVRAGLIPWLAQKWGSQFVKIIFTPDQDPFESFYASLLSKYKQADAQIAREAKADTLHRVITQLKQPDEYWLIAIDQFEELFTTTQGDKREIFINSLIYLNKIKHNSVKIIGTMRADFLDKLSPHPKLVKMTDKHRPMIAEMQPDELRLAIEQPAAHHGVIINPELVQEILKDIQGQAGYLPLLQYTLNLLWETELKHNLIQERTLNLDTYRQLGRVQGALQKHVNTLYEALSPEEKQATQRIFLKLVDIGEDAASGGEWKPIRRRASKSLFTSKLEQQVLLKLIDENLLVSDFSTDTQESTIDITHEILLTSWTLLNDWIKENREAIAIRNRLNQDMNLWKSKKREDELWSGSKLQQVIDLTIDPSFNQVLGGFSREENEFIERSKGRRDRQRRKTIVALTGFSTVALILASFAGWQWRSAEISKNDSIVFSSKLLFQEEQVLDSLIQNLRASISLKRWKIQPSMDSLNALRQSVYEVREINRRETLSSINSVAFSLDGKTLAFSSDDKNVYLWDLESGKKPSSLSGHDYWVGSIAFSPTNSKIFISSSGDQTVKLWNLDSTDEKKHKTLYKHEDRVTNIAFSNDGRILASTSVDKTIVLWDINTNQEIYKYTEKSGIFSLIISADGQKLAYGTDDGTIKVWQIEDLKKLKNNAEDSHEKLIKNSTSITISTGEQERVTSLAFSLNGEILAVSQGQNIQFWNIINPKEIKLKNTWEHDKKVARLALSPDGKTLAFGSTEDTKIIILNIENMHKIQNIQELKGHKNGVTGIAFNPDGKTLASTSKDKTVRIWNIENMTSNNPNNYETILKHKSSVRSIAFSSDGQVLASGSQDNTIKILDLPSKHESIINGHDKKILTLAFHPKKKILASGSGDSIIKLWDLESKKTDIAKKYFQINRPPITDIDAPTQTFGKHGNKAIMSIAFSPNGKILASAGEDNTIKFWDVASGKVINTLDKQKAPIMSIAFSPNGKILASGSQDNTLKIWDVASGEQIIALNEHKDWVMSVAFSPDGKTLTSGSLDKNIMLWSVNNNKITQPPVVLRGHEATIRNVAFSGDSKTLFSGDDQGKIKLWNVTNEKEIGTLFSNEDKVYQVAFHPDKKLLASAHANNTVVLWRFDIKYLIQKGCNSLINNYLKTSSNVSEKDRKMCEGIPTNQ